ncbi:unnamed protein product [Caenorhabditis brenneri]
MPHQSARQPAHPGSGPWTNHMMLNNDLSNDHHIGTSGSPFPSETAAPMMTPGSPSRFFCPRLLPKWKREKNELRYAANGNGGDGKPKRAPGSPLVQTMRFEDEKRINIFNCCPNEDAENRGGEEAPTRAPGSPLAQTMRFEDEKRINIFKRCPKQVKLDEDRRAPGSPLNQTEDVKRINHLNQCTDEESH